MVSCEPDDDNASAQDIFEEQRREHQRAMEQMRARGKEVRSQAHADRIGHVEAERAHEAAFARQRVRNPQAKSDFFAPVPDADEFFREQKDVKLKNKDEVLAARDRQIRAQANVDKLRASGKQFFLRQETEASWAALTAERVAWENGGGKGGLPTLFRGKSPAACGPCMACDNAYTSGRTPWIRLPCTHWVHEGCADIWVTRDPRCPDCKKVVGGVKARAKPAEAEAVRVERPAADYGADRKVVYAD